MKTNDTLLPDFQQNLLRDASKKYHAFISEKAKDNSYLRDKLTGCFYTPSAIYEHMVSHIATILRGKNRIKIIDPFAGDGRLVVALLQEIITKGIIKSKAEITITLVDINESGLIEAQKKLSSLLTDDKNISLAIDIRCVDAFAELTKNEVYDVCITNPPWCILKFSQKIGDKLLSATEQSEYLNLVSNYVSSLKEAYPASAEAVAGFSHGINLSRCGLDVSLSLLSPQGVLAIVLPATFLSDQVSVKQRKILFENYSTDTICYYPPECKLFGHVDQSCITMVLEKKKALDDGITLNVYKKDMTYSTIHLLNSELDYIRKNKYIIPLEYSSEQIKLLSKFESLPSLSDYSGVHIVRELDETRMAEKLADKGQYLFIKGYMIERYGIAESPQKYVIESFLPTTKSLLCSKIVWRDVSRASQRRRMHATLLKSGYVAGNSLGVLYLDSKDEKELLWLLAVMNSYVFEFQTKQALISNHVPAGIIKKIKIPASSCHIEEIVSKVQDILNSDDTSTNQTTTEMILEILVAKEYGLSYDDFSSVVSSFQMSNAEREKLLDLTAKEIKMSSTPPNHYAAKLSTLDKLIVSHVPQGGNWKNIPETVPSQRLVNIRKSFAEGKGSRSTYYGRLRENFPAYTISTYFGRPGNGCNIHYSQERTLSQREAARIQGFPDSFEFLGSKVAINDQIGNAVPPILAYQLAAELHLNGAFVDLFCGAGGLALGFIWAGWTPIISNDINEAALNTHAHNISERTICGDITSEHVIQSIVESCKKYKKKNPCTPLFVIGGPPCQGFSTANCNRSTGDQRNWLFKAYVRILKEINPDGFIFENVTGILNFEGGEFFEMIKKDLKVCVEEIKTMKLNCAEYGVPQRRERVIVLGAAKEIVRNFNLQPVTMLPSKVTETPLFPLENECQKHPAISVKEALDDLPIISDAQDGSSLPYRIPPKTMYQKLMRGEMSIKDYISALRERN